MFSLVVCLTNAEGLWQVLWNILAASISVPSSHRCRVLVSSPSSLQGVDVPLPVRCDPQRDEAGDERPLVRQRLLPAQPARLRSARRQGLVVLATHTRSGGPRNSHKVWPGGPLTDTRSGSPVWSVLRGLLSRHNVIVSRVSSSSVRSACHRALSVIVLCKECVSSSLCPRCHRLLWEVLVIVSRVSSFSVRSECHRALRVIIRCEECVSSCPRRLSAGGRWEDRGARLGSHLQRPVPGQGGEQQDHGETTITAAATMAEWLRAWDTVAMMKLQGEVISSTSMAEWLRAWDTAAVMKLWRREVVSSASMAEWLRAWDTAAMMKLWRREVVSSASMAEWLRAWDTAAMMKLRRRKVVSSASMAEWLRAWDTAAMMKLWRREVVSSASMAEWLMEWNNMYIVCK